MSAILSEHLSYVADARRTALFREAIARTIKPGDVVADLGCGSGILGLLCLQAGARHVYAIDSTAAVEIARETFKRAGHEQQVTLIQGRTFQVELPARVDVMICDHVGFFGFDYGLVELMADAAKRFLKPGGIALPRKLQLKLSAVGSDACEKLVGGWQAPGVPDEFHWLRSHTVNQTHPIELKPADVLCKPATLREFTLGEPAPAFMAERVKLTAARDGAVRGLAGWFECELTDGVWMTNSPLAESAITRPQLFLPIESALDVKAGDEIEASFMTRPAEHVMAWELHHARSDSRFSQSTWAAELGLTVERLRRTQPNRVTTLSPQGNARRVILSLCDGQRTRQQIIDTVMREHPALLPSPEETLRFVDEVLIGNSIA